MKKSPIRHTFDVGCWPRGRKIHYRREKTLRIAYTLMVPKRPPPRA